MGIVSTHKKTVVCNVVLLGNSPVSRKTKKQGTMSHPSAEAENRVMAATLRELKLLKRLLVDLGVLQSDMMEMYCDSQYALHIATNPVFHESTKHIKVHCHSMRDAVQEKLITTRHVRKNEQLANIMTKALGSSTFGYLLSKLGACGLHAPT